MRPKLIKISFTILVILGLVFPAFPFGYTAGTIDLGLSSPTENFEPLEIALNMKPGDLVKREIRIFNAGTNPLGYSLIVEKISGDDNFCNALQLEIILEKEELVPAGTEFVVPSYCELIEPTLIECREGGPAPNLDPPIFGESYTSGEEPPEASEPRLITERIYTYSGNLMNATLGVSYLGISYPENENKLYFTATLPTEAPPILQNKTCEFKFIFSAQQILNEPGEPESSTSTEDVLTLLLPNVALAYFTDVEVTTNILKSGSWEPFSSIEGEGASPTAESFNPNAIALLIQDYNPWYGKNTHDALNELNVPHDVINSSHLASWDLDKYQFILYASAQDNNYYLNLKNNLQKISDFVSNGGLLIAHSCDGGWDSTGSWRSFSILPGGVTHLMHWDGQKYLSQSIRITDPNHPIVKSDEFTITDDYLDGWGYSTHGIFTNFLNNPNIKNPKIVMESDEGDGGDGPTYIDYDYGVGKVLATMQTAEWGYFNGSQGWVGNRPELLQNEIRFAKKWTKKWSFAIITDLHIGGKWYPCLLPWGCYQSLDYGDSTWNDDDTGKEYITTVFLRNAIKLINSNREKYNIKFVVVDGDLTDSAEMSELNMVKKILDEELNPEIPWIPLIGNHDMWPYATDDSEAPSSPPPEIYFHTLFKTQYEDLSYQLLNWEKGPELVFDPDLLVKRQTLFQNFAFDYSDYHFISLDFNSRIAAPAAPGTLAEADLHKFTDGTWDWFTKHLEKYINEHPTSSENVILFAHHPFNKGTIVSYMGFEDAELIIMEKFLKNYKDNIYGEFAGHTHQNKDYMWWSEIMRIIETDANVKSSLVRIVQIDPVKKLGEQIDYSKMLGYGITAKTTCPVDLEIIDPDGLIISQQLNEILGAIYIEEDINGDGSPDDWIGIPERKLGDYQIKVIPEVDATPTSTYTLEVSTLEDSFGYVPIVLAQDTPISEIPTEPYIFASKEKEATQLTYTGDLSGQFSDSVNLTATLTDSDGNPLSNKEITFTIGSQSTSTITNENGIATASLVLDQVPGKYYLVDATFFGDEDYSPSSDTQSFEILKENVAINVENKEGFYDDSVTLEAEVLDDDGETPLHGPYQVEFKVRGEVIGQATIDEAGKAKIDWKVDFIPKELIENYLIIVTFAENEYYNPAQGQGEFTLKSAKWLKEDAISELEAAKTGDKRIDKKIEKIIWLINKSLDEDLWIDTSRLIFFEKGKWNFDFKEFEKENPEKIFDLKNLGKARGPKAGIMVFHYEKVAVRLMMQKPKFEEFEIPEWLENKDEFKDFKDWKIPDQLKPVFERVIGKLVKADILLAKVSIFDAKNTPAQNPKFQKIVEKQIERAEKELEKAYQELEKGRPDKAIMRLSKAWLHSQLAIKFAILELKRP